MIASIDSGEACCRDERMPLELWMGNRRHASSVKAMRAKVVTRRQSKEGVRMIAGWYRHFEADGTRYQRYGSEIMVG